MCSDVCIYDVYELVWVVFRCLVYFVFQAEDGRRDLGRSRGLGDVYKRQIHRVQFPKVGRGRPERVQGSGLKCGVTGPVAISVSTPTPERSRVPGAGSTYLGTAPPPNLPHKSGSSFMDGMDEFPDNRQLIAESFGLWASAYTMLYYSFGKFHFQR